MIAVLGLLAAAFSIAVIWPQVWLSCRHGRTLGLSPTSTWLSVALNLCWLSFGLLTGDRAQILQLGARERTRGVRAFGGVRKHSLQLRFLV